MVFYEPSLATGVAGLRVITRIASKFILFREWIGIFYRW